MFGKCTRKLTIRWAMLVGVLTGLSYFVFWLISGRLPASDTIRLLPESGQNDVLASMPVVVTRLIDPLVVMIPTALMAWMCFDAELIAKRLRSGGGFKSVISAEEAMMVGAVCGFLGSLVIGLTGFSGLIIGTVVVSAIVVLYNSTSTIAPHAFVVELVAVTVIWGLNTLYQGAAIGFVYAVSALAVAAATHFGLLGLVGGIRRAKGPFQRVMLSCDNGD